ncbi:MAG: RluA family pseudouridine synthase [Bacteroidales bacterium]|nr:RluA family pseudouridine synthase [Bacteroidales bacterium]
MALYDDDMEMEDAPEPIEGETIDHGNGQMTERYRTTVDQKQELQRVDKYLDNRIPGVSRNKIQEAAKDGCILVNNKPVKSNYRVHPGDEVVVMLPGEHFEFKLEPEDIPLDIVYEDDDLIVVNKKAGMVVHPAHGNFTGTLVNALAFHIGEENQQFDTNDTRPGLVHRIDKNTSGLLVIAKNEKSKVHLAKQFFHHTVNRRYQALVWGDIAEKEGTIVGNIGRDPKDRKAMRIFPEDSGIGKPAITHYRVLERFGYVTLIECKLETGRTHQIRVHMKSQSHPLFGDDVYGGDKILRGTTFAKYRRFVENCFAIMPRQGLHAKTLEFVHPTTKKVMSFDSEIPADMQEVIEKWRIYAQAGMTFTKDEEDTDQ